MVRIVNRVKKVDILVKLSTFFVIGLFCGYQSIGQNQTTTKNVIQFTGVVFAEDSATIIPGVHIYTPTSGRGTTSNPYGFFSMPVIEGDSIIFSAIGFERTHYIVPKHDSRSSLKLLVYLKEDITFLEEVEVFPYPSEAAFKAAVLAADLPYRREYENLNDWLNSEYMRRPWEYPEASPNINYRYFMQQQMNAQIYRVQPPQNPLLNPFAWANFIRSLQRNKKK